MRHLMIATVSAVLLAAGPAMAAGDNVTAGDPGLPPGNYNQPAPYPQIGPSGSTNWTETETYATAPADTMIMDRGDMANTGRSGATDEYLMPRNRAEAPQRNQTATGTHCPPGRPYCGPNTATGGGSGGGPGGNGL